MHQPWKSAITPKMSTLGKTQKVLKKQLGGLTFRSHTLNEFERGKVVMSAEGVSNGGFSKSGSDEPLMNSNPKNQTNRYQPDQIPQNMDSNQ